MLKKTLTLVELIIAIALLAVIVIGAASFDIGSRGMLKASETKTQVLNEATLILDRIAKDASLGIGDASSTGGIPNSALSTAGTSPNPVYLLIKQDTNPNGIREANTIDHVIAYGRNNNDIVRCEITSDPVVIPAACPALTQRATIPDGFRILTISPNTAQISVTLRYSPNGAPDAFSNPQVQAETTIEVPGQSLQ